MPPRIATPGAAPTLGDQYRAIPPLTRALATGVVALTLGDKLGLVRASSLVLYWPLVVKRLQLWRLVTSFLYLGPLSFNWLFNMVWLIQYGKSVEATVFPGDTPAAIWATACGCMIMMLASLVLPFLFALAAYGPSLVMFLLYLSVRHHPTAPVSLFGFVTLQSVYLPWAFLVLGFAGLGGDPRGVGLGILAGHVVWFLTDVFPRGGGRALLAPPAWLVRACLARGIGAIPTPAAVAATVNPADPGFRAFVGRGQRLGQRTG